MLFENWKAKVHYFDRQEAFNECGLTLGDDIRNAMVYYGNSYIERADHADGAWMLTIGNESEITNDLLRLEIQLYMWSVDEGILDDYIDDFEVLEWLVNADARISYSAGRASVTYYDGKRIPREETADTKLEAVYRAYCRSSVRDFLQEHGISSYSMNID